MLRRNAFEERVQSWRKFSKTLEKPEPVKAPAPSAAAAAVEQDQIFTDTFIINAHGLIPDKTFKVLPHNCTMVKSYPGFNIVQETSPQLFSNMIKNYRGETTAKQALNYIKEFYSSGETSFIGGIYEPHTRYTDMDITFNVNQKKEDDGNIIHFHKTIGVPTLKYLTELQTLYHSIFNFKNMRGGGNYVVKLSHIIDVITAISNGAPFLLVVLSCSYTNDGELRDLEQASAAMEDPDHVRRLKININGYYSKYLKYKKKYLNLKKLLN